MRLIADNEPIDANKRYVVGGWGSINENVSGPAIYDMLESYIVEEQLVRPKNPSPVRVSGM